MGYVKHNALIVTSGDRDILTKAHKQAMRKFGKYTTPIVKKGWNAYRSFMIAPDGSKEGWQTSQKYERRRKKYFKWLKQNCENSLDAIEVRYGGDDENTEIVDKY